ncbi:MAG: aldo/keto reductase [Bacteroidales bacterium]
MKNKGTNRRHFIRNLSLTLMGTTAFSRKAFSIGSDQLSKESLDNKKIIQYKTLGRTGFKVSDIASGAPKNETALRALIESGVNFIDTGHTYGNGNNERLIGKVIKDYDRKKLFINSKLYTDGNGSSESESGYGEFCITR